MNNLRHNDRLASSTGFRIAVIVLVAINLPLFFISLNVRVLTNSQAFYEWGFDSNNVERRSGLDDAALTSAAGQIIDYFGNDEEFLDLRVDFEGDEIALFNEREITHMADVKDVMNVVFNAVWVTGAVLIIVVGGGFFLLGRRFLPLLRSAIVWSTIAGLAVAALFGMATLIDFNTTFRLFHEVTFRNDFWKLSPSESLLLRLFPVGFWFAATLILVVLTALQLGVVYGAAWWASRTRSAG
ncbi:MAG: TIGR01906 family membrane protein [Dehalococcoidia bacterium]|jgi:integral membrane protein (TIGR01906 family)|nr:TIGR01906 family membrane protein [Dehalococcoidia bacterium]